MYYYATFLAWKWVSYAQFSDYCMWFVGPYPKESVEISSRNWQSYAQFSDFDLVCLCMVWFGFVWYCLCVLFRATTMQNLNLMSWKWVSYAPGCLNILNFLQICQKIHDFLRNRVALGKYHQGRMIVVTASLGYGTITI